MFPNFLTFVAFILIYIPMFYLYFNKKSRDKFFKLNSKGIFVLVEIFSGLLYAFIILFTLFLGKDSSFFLQIIGSIVYLISLILTYIGYFKFVDKQDLIERFPFNLSRNPTYFFSFIAIFGIVLFSGSVILFVLLALQFILTHIIILNEEKYLERQYDRKYQEYKQKVKRYI